jgi:hypothetical protein
MISAGEGIVEKPDGLFETSTTQHTYFPNLIPNSGSANPEPNSKEPISGLFFIIYKE